jgi:hypothetical protein
MCCDMRLRAVGFNFHKCCALRQIKLIDVEMFVNLSKLKIILYKYNGIDKIYLKITMGTGNEGFILLLILNSAER